jgi:hypothetical protein
LVMFTYTRRRVPVIPPKCVKSHKNQKVLYTVPEVSHTNRYTRRETGIEAFYGRHQDGKYGHFPARAREGFCVRQDENTWLFLHGATAAAIYFLGHLAAGHVIMPAQYACRHICRTHAHGGELEAPSRIFLERDSAWRDVIHGPGYLVDRGSKVAVIHADDRFPCLFDPVHDLLVFDLQFGIALDLLSYTLPEVVVLT